MLTRCRCAPATPVCIIRAHKNDHIRTLKILQSMSEVRWIMEMQKKPACTLISYKMMIAYDMSFRLKN